MRITPEEQPLAEEGQVVTRLLKVPEVCERLALSRSEVYELMSSGALPSLKLGRARRVVDADLEDYINQLRLQAAEA